MKVLRIILHILGTLLAVFFSLVTFLTLLLTPAISTGTSLLQPDTLHMAIKDWDLSTHLETQLKASASDSSLIIDSQLLDSLLDSQLVNDLLDLYLDNFLGVLEQEQMASITQKDVDMLLEKHMPDLISQVRPHIPEELGLSDQDIISFITLTLSPYLMELTKTLPTLNDMGLDPSIIQIIHTFYDKSLLKTTYLILILSTLLIFLCRIPRFKGFIWITVVYTFAAFVLLPISGFVTPFTENLFSKHSLTELEFLFHSFVQILKSNMTKGGIICIVVAVLSLVLYIVSNVIRKAISGSKDLLAA